MSLNAGYLPSPYTNIIIIMASMIDLFVLNLVIKRNLLYFQIPHVRHSRHHVKEHI